MEELFTQAEKDMMMSEIVHKFVNDVLNESINAINNFYGGYHPKVYNRQGGLNYMWQTDFDKSIDSMSATITYSSSFIGGFHESDDMVFVGPFLQGYHGGPKYFGGHAAPKTSPSPWMEIQSFVNSYSL